VRRGRRIAVLLLVFAVVAAGTYGERAWVRSWSRPLAVTIYPLAIDAHSADYVTQVRPEDFQEIATFIEAEAKRWRRQATAPLRLTLKQPLSELPPLPQGRGVLESIKYSLQLRWYAFRQTSFRENFGGLRLFVLYHQPRADEALPHSLGLQKGLLGVVHVFATDAQRAQNNVVIAHELLHTLGATDKYDQAGQPQFPEGFAEFTAEPLYPQQQAEIMAGRIPLSASNAVIPAGLHEVVVGYKTASEIGW
jgi:hypothetical protein